MNDDGVEIVNIYTCDVRLMGHIEGAPESRMIDLQERLSAYVDPAANAAKAARRDRLAFECHIDSLSRDVMHVVFGTVFLSYFYCAHCEACTEYQFAASKLGRAKALIIAATKDAQFRKIPEQCLLSPSEHHDISSFGDIYSGALNSHRDASFEIGAARRLLKALDPTMTTKAPRGSLNDKVFRSVYICVIMKGYFETYR